jgi:hypothetical protein
MTQRLAVALVAVLSSNAFAQTYAQPVIATGGDMPGRPEQPAQHSIDGRVGMVLGGSDVGDANGFSIGAAGGLGYRIGDVTLRGTFDYYRVGDGSDEAQHRRGRASRFGAAARYSFANLGADSTAICDFWGELGAGYEHVDWMHGGVLDRPNVELALGFDFGGRGDRDRYGRRHSAGYYMAFRTFLAEAPPQPDAMATCGGPCDTATTPSRTDVTMFFDFGVHFGH